MRRVSVVRPTDLDMCSVIPSLSRDLRWADRAEMFRLRFASLGMTTRNVCKAISDALHWRDATRCNEWVRECVGVPLPGGALRLLAVMQNDSVQEHCNAGRLGAGIFARRRQRNIHGQIVVPGDSRLLPEDCGSDYGRPRDVAGVKV